MSKTNAGTAELSFIEQEKNWHPDLYKYLGLLGYDLKKKLNNSQESLTTYEITIVVEINGVIEHVSMQNWKTRGECEIDVGILQHYLELELLEADEENVNTYRDEEGEEPVISHLKVQVFYQPV